MRLLAILFGAATLLTAAEARAQSLRLDTPYFCWPTRVHSTDPAQPTGFVQNEESAQQRFALTIVEISELDRTGCFGLLDTLDESLCSSIVARKFKIIYRNRSFGSTNNFHYAISGSDENVPRIFGGPEDNIVFSIMDQEIRYRHAVAFGGELAIQFGTCTYFDSN